MFKWLYSPILTTHFCDKKETNMVRWISINYNLWKLTNKNWVYAYFRKITNCNITWGNPRGERGKVLKRWCLDRKFALCRGLISAASTTSATASSTAIATTSTAVSTISTAVSTISTAVDPTTVSVDSIVSAVVTAATAISTSTTSTSTTSTTSTSTTSTSTTLLIFQILLLLGLSRFALNQRCCKTSFLDGNFFVESNIDIILNHRWANCCGTMIPTISEALKVSGIRESLTPCKASF